MRCEDISAKSVDYLAGGLDEADCKEVKSHLNSCPVCRAEFDGLSKTLAQLGELPSIAPDTLAMRARFDSLLSEFAHSTVTPDMPEADPSPSPRMSDTAVLPGRNAAPARRHSARNPIASRLQRFIALRPALQVCAALLLVCIGVQLGRQTAPSRSADVRELSQEVRDLRQMVILSLMQQQSASERLKGVNWSSQVDRPGNEIVAALIETLMHDPNVNVRMASIDALKRFADRDTVRTATLQALVSQASPLVQMALIDFVVETRDRGAIDALRRLSGDRTIDSAVRARAAWGINHLEAA